MNKNSLIALAVLAALSSSAFAADVEVYGRIDTGLQFNHSDPGVGDSSSTLKMHTGQHDANRVGLKGKEKISSNLTVGFQLETGFNADDGTLKNNDPKHSSDTLFDREAQLYLTGNFGKLGFGRMGLLRSGAGSYCLLGDVSAMTTGWGNVGDQGAILPSIGTSRMDNTIVYQSPEVSGLKLHAQYSMGSAYKDTTTQEWQGVENESSVDRYLGLGVTYANGPLKIVGLVDTVNEKSYLTGKDPEDMVSFTLAANYDFGAARAYLLGQYFKDANAIGSLPGVSNSKLGGDEIKGYTVMTGVKVPVGSGSFRFTVGYVHAKDDGRTATVGADNKINRFLIGTGYDYNFSKTVTAYVGAGYWKDNYTFQTDKVDDASNIQVLAGLVKRF